MIGARMKRIIIQGAMNHESGTEIAKLLTTTAGIQKKAWDISAGELTTKITPTPKTTAFTMQKISAATPQPREVIAVHGLSSFLR